MAGLLSAIAIAAEPPWRDIDAAPHHYRQRTPADRFTKIKDDLESGRVPLDRSSEKAFIGSLLAALKIPASSQMLVFSTTSLQLRFITPSNPRALFFNDDVYVGYIPGGRVEIVALDPELGAIFYIFDIPRDSAPLRVERSERCMNCHAAEDTNYVPGLVVKSVMPGPRGGSLQAFRQQQTGHGIPFDQRLGGWYVTGEHAITNHLGNAFGRFVDGALTKLPIEPGRLFDFGRYPAATSDILPLLLLEHQAGFVNRVVEGGYRARTALHASGGKLSAEQRTELNEQARIIARYILFADEAPLPAGGVVGSAAFKREFLAAGGALREFDLRTRLFKNRCSYMIESAVFTGLPAEMKRLVFQQIHAALDTEKPDPAFAYLPVDEKRAIRTLLRMTKELPSPNDQ
jgi:hypothetical protein